LAIGSQTTAFWLVALAIGSQTTAFWLVALAIGSQTTAFWPVGQSPAGTVPTRNAYYLISVPLATTTIPDSVT